MKKRQEASFETETTTTRQVFGKIAHIPSGSDGFVTLSSDPNVKETCISVRTGQTL